MKPITFVLIGLSLGGALTGATTPSQELEDYGLGREVGRCLAVRCQIFTGFILTEIPKPEEPIAVRVEETLFGSGGGPKVVRIPWQDDPRHGGGYVSAAWLKAETKRGAPVSVVLALEQGLAVFPGEPVLVTSSERDSRIIRSLADDAKRLRESPESISDMVASLSGNANPPLAGYLFFHLTYGKANYSRYLFATLLSGLLASLVGPADQEMAATGFLVAPYTSLEPSTQAGVIARLVELTRRPDLHGARTAFEGLARIASLDHRVVGMLPPASMPALGAAYRQLVKTGSIAAEPLLEQMLGKKR